MGLADRIANDVVKESTSSYGMTDAQRLVFDPIIEHLKARVVRVQPDGSGRVYVKLGPIAGKRGVQTLGSLALKQLARAPVEYITFDRDGVSFAFKA